MEIAEDKTGLFESLIEKAEAYGKTSYELLKLKAVDKVAGGLSSAVSQVVAFLLLFMFLGIASVGISLWLGEVLGKTYYGFFCVAGFYAIIGLALVIIKNNFIKRKVSDAIIEHALE
jgi:hypothetical protein